MWCWTDWYFDAKSLIISGQNQMNIRNLILLDHSYIKYLTWAKKKIYLNIMRKIKFGVPRNLQLK